MLAVIVPAHNEEQDLPACLRSLQLAASCDGLQGEAVRIITVLDACTDASETIAIAHGATVLHVEARNVGMARDAGAQLALSMGARWLAFTDADTVVSRTWLSTLLALAGDAVCGTVSVTGWDEYADQTRTRYDQCYRDCDGHRHIHGANLAVSAEAYLRSGGFPPLASSEDVALVRSLEASGASIVWSAAPRVTTSARRRYKAPSGFGATLAQLEALSEAAVACPSGVA